ncbi:hypothetical protein GJ496_011460 [Pomphorhynchus laevis]|nr:hypothetical protein GJ496_011460 [Pomphorhynchus laevis]
MPSGSRRKQIVPQKLNTPDNQNLIDFSVMQFNNDVKLYSFHNDINLNSFHDDSKLERHNLCQNDVKLNSAICPKSKLENPNFNIQIECDMEQAAANKNYLATCKGGNQSIELENGKRKRQYNVEVDPAKYRRIYDEERGVRYACSICGNVYKWRKSLNKHWKEKHRLENPPPLDAPVPIKDIPILSPATVNRTTSNHVIGSYTTPDNGDSGIVKKEVVASLQNHSNVGIIMDRNNAGKISSYDGNRLISTAASSIPHPAFNIDNNSGNYLGNSQMRMFIQRPHININGGQKENGEALLNKYNGNFSNPQPAPCKLNNIDRSTTPISSKMRRQKRENIQLQCDLSTTEPLDLSIKYIGGKLECQTDAYVTNEFITDSKSSESPTSYSTFPTQSIDIGTDDPDPIRQNDIQSYRSKIIISNALSNSQKYFVCAICCIKSSSLESANEHFSGYHIGELEREISGKSPPRNTNVAQQNEQWRLSDPTNPLKCVRCDFVGRWPTELQKHAASHSTMRPFKCMICSLTYKWRWDLAKHFDRAHPKFINPYKKRDRDHAKTVIEQTNQDADYRRRPNSPNDFHAPVRRKRRTRDKVAEDRFIPDTATTSVYSSSDMESNSTVHVVVDQTEKDLSILEPKPNKDRSGFTCNWCDYQGRWRSELFQHMRCYHARDKPYHCSACNYSSNWKWDVQKHVRKQHKTKTSQSADYSIDISDVAVVPAPHVIEIPDKFLFDLSLTEEYVESFIKDDSLKNKLYSLLTRCESIYSCELCPHTALTPADHQRHVLIHGDVKPYRCFHCDYDSKWKCDVKKHMISEAHQGLLVKPHKVKKRRLTDNQSEDYLTESSFSTTEDFDDSFDDLDKMGKQHLGEDLKGQIRHDPNNNISSDSEADGFRDCDNNSCSGVHQRVTQTAVESNYQTTKALPQVDLSSVMVRLTNIDQELAQLDTNRWSPLDPNWMHENEGKKYVCIVCNQYKAPIFAMYNHFITEHDKDDKFESCIWKCPMCPDNFDNFYEVIFHARNHPNLKLVEDEYMYTNLGVWNDYSGYYKIKILIRKTITAIACVIREYLIISEYSGGKGKYVFKRDRFRRRENARSLAVDHIEKLQAVVMKRFAFGDSSLLDFYLQWRLASSIIAGIDRELDKSIQLECIHEYIKVFSFLLRIPFYSSKFTISALRNLVLRTYHVNGDWLKAFVIVINSVNSHLIRDVITNMNPDGDNLLHVYIREGSYDRGLLELLINLCGANSANFRGETPLKLAMLRDENSKRLFITQLLESGVDINYSLNSLFNSSDNREIISTNTTNQVNGS